MSDAGWGGAARAPDRTLCSVQNVAGASRILTVPAGRGYPRLLKLLKLLAEQPGGVTAAEVQAALGIPRSSAWLLIQHVLAEGFAVARDGRYVMGPQLITLGLTINEAVSVGTGRRDVLIDLSREVGLDVYLAIRVDDSVIYTERVEGPGAVHLNFTLGTPRPLHATAVGKLFLALDDTGLWDRAIRGQTLQKFTDRTLVGKQKLEQSLAEIRSQGYAVSHGERLAGIASLAAPVMGVDGSMSAALLLSGHESAILPRIGDLVEPLFATCRRLTSLVDRGSDALSTLRVQA
jgi:DNA-binding IclR family transcriptional regulator